MYLIESKDPSYFLAVGLMSRPQIDVLSWYDPTSSRQVTIDELTTLEDGSILARVRRHSGETEDIKFMPLTEDAYNALDQQLLKEKLNWQGGDFEAFLEAVSQAAGSGW